MQKKNKIWKTKSVSHGGGVYRISASQYLPAKTLFSNVPCNRFQRRLPFTEFGYLPILPGFGWNKKPKSKKKNWLHWFFQVRILLRDDDGGDLDDDGDDDGDKDENDERFYLSRFRSVNFTQV